MSPAHTHKKSRPLNLKLPLRDYLKFGSLVRVKKKSADTLRNNHSDSTEFKVASHPCVLGTTKAVLGMNRLQGLRKLKVSACWQNVMLHRRISDKPGVRFSSVAPVISMEMSWGVAAPLSPPTTPVPCHAGDCIYANMGISGVESSSGSSCSRFILSVSSPRSFLRCFTSYLACCAHEKNTASSHIFFFFTASHLFFFLPPHHIFYFFF